MSKIRVIDLLNKIANGEEVPEEIKIRTRIFKLDKDYKVYNINYVYVDGNKDYWLDNVQLDEEVITLKEDKEIEHYDMFDNFTGFGFGGTDKELLSDLENNFVHINEELDYLIKALNELKKGK